MQLCDTHCHLDDKRFEGDFEAVFGRGKKGGGTRFVFPAAPLEDLGRGGGVSHKNFEGFFGRGLDPHYVDFLLFLLYI